MYCRPIDGDEQFNNLLSNTARSGIENGLTGSDTGLVTRTVLVAKDLSGTYQNIRSDYNGDLNIAVHSDAFLNLSIEEIFAAYGDRVILKPKTLFKFGENQDIDVGTIETIWARGGDETYVSDNLINRIVSTDTNDTTTVKIEGHTLSGSDFTFVVQEVTLTGQTPVALPTPIARCSRIYNNSGTELVGSLTVYESVGATVTLGVVTPASLVHCTTILGDQISSKCATTFSSVDYAMITQLTGGPSAKTNAIVQFTLEIREFGGVFRQKYKWSASGSSVVINLQPYILVPKNADVRIRGLTNTNNTEAFASFNTKFGLVQ